MWSPPAGKYNSENEAMDEDYAAAAATADVDDVDGIKAAASPDSDVNDALSDAPKAGSSSVGGASDAGSDIGDGERSDDVVDAPIELHGCKALFSTTDFIMECDVMTHLTEYFSNGGDPLLVINMLSNNYDGMAQCANVLANWLIDLGMSSDEVKQIVEDKLKDMIIKYFSPEKTEKIFTQANEAPVWLTEMVKHPTWRRVFYKLAEQHPDCITVKYCIKLISDHGFQEEITSEITASHQIEVFSRVLRSMVSRFFEGSESESVAQLPEIAKMVCHGEHTYLYTQSLLHALMQESKQSPAVKRLSQEILKSATENGFDTTPITMALSGAATFPRACQAITAMLKKGQLNPADISILYKMYQAGEPPPVELIRTPHLLDLFLDTLFKPGTQINPEHKAKYLYILAYAASVQENMRKGGRRSVGLQKDEFKPTLTAIEKVHEICQQNKSSSDLVSDVQVLFQCVRYPIIALGLLRYIEYVILDPAFFKLNTDSTPTHLLLLDEIATLHNLLHTSVMNLIKKLLDLALEEMENLVQLELKKTFLDRMVHLLSRGYVLQVIEYVREKYDSQDMDVSLIRHFVTEVLDIISPPYSEEFVVHFLPLIHNKEITGPLKYEDGSTDPVMEFLDHCEDL